MSASRVCFALCVIFLLLSGLQAQDLKTEDIVSKHLASIGNDEKRGQLKNMMLLGVGQFESKLPERRSIGKVAIVSNASNLLFISSFAAENYPFEKIGLFGGKVKIPFVVSGIRSPLGDFLSENPRILESGLFSGSMSLQWSLLEGNLKKGKVKFGGTKKIDDRKAYVLDYFMEGASDSLTVRLFFDAETFQHIRSHYREVIPGKEATFGVLGRNNGFETELTEDFSDFKSYEGITLPNASKIRYVVLSSKGTFEYDWIFKMNEVKFNQTLKEDFFNF